MPGETTWVPRAHLPPVGIILVYNLEQVPSIKPQACFFARDEVVSGWVVVKVALHKYLAGDQWAGGGEVSEAGEGWRGHAFSHLPQVERASQSPPSPSSLTKMTEALALPI